MEHKPLNELMKIGSPLYQLQASFDQKMWQPSQAELRKLVDVYDQMLAAEWSARHDLLPTSHELN